MSGFFEKGKFTHHFSPDHPAKSFSEDAALTIVKDGRYVLFSPNGRGSIEIYDLKEEKYVGYTGTNKGSGGPLIPTPDGKYLIGGGASDNLVLIKVEDVLKLVEAPAKKP